MKPTVSNTSPNPTDALTIRMAVPADAVALSRLAQLDSASPPEPARMLVAQIGGDLRAAVPLEGGRAIADPFHRTAELVAILVERAHQLERPAGRRAARRWGLLRTLRPAPGGQA